MNNACCNFPQPKMLSSDVMFCPRNSPKPKAVQFTIMYEEDSIKTSHLRGWTQQMFDTVA